ncbi:MAG: type III pantothenate kinase [Clostridiales bacterium]|nr:type III pantothenate kinase [Clostridiales bacterium]
MILTIDIGNTTMTMGLYTPEGELQFRGSIKTDKNKTRDQIAIDLLDMFHLYRADIRGISGAVVSSVVPPMTSAMADAIEQLSGIRPMIVGPGVKTGMNILAEVHNQLGADIVASSVAALQKYPQPIIVIDMGTATTLSYLGESTYKGCVIIPGVRIAVEALSGRAAELPHISLEEPPSIFGRSTIDAMRSGVLFGNAGMIDSMIERMEEAAKPVATVVMTGGNASLIQKYCKREILIDENLLLDGLYYLYQKNHDRRRKKND